MLVKFIDFMFHSCKQPFWILQKKTLYKSIIIIIIIIIIVIYLSGFPSQRSLVHMDVGKDVVQ